MVKYGKIKSIASEMHNLVYIIQIIHKRFTHIYTMHHCVYVYKLLTVQICLIKALRNHGKNVWVSTNIYLSNAYTFTSANGYRRNNFKFPVIVY